MTQPVLIQYPGESDIYDIDCSDDLPAGATITSVIGITADTNGLTFGTPIINPSPATYADKRTAPASTVIQVRISNAETKPVDKSFVIRANYNESSGGSPRQARVVLRVKD